MKDYRINADAGAYSLNGQDADLRHVAPLANDHPLLVKLGSVSSNHADIEWYLREAIDVLDTGPKKSLVRKVALANQVQKIGSVLLEALALAAMDGPTQERAEAIIQQLLYLQEERNRLAHDPWREDKKTGELIQLRTRGADKVVLVPESKVDEVVDGFRRLRDEIVELHAAIWKHMNPS